MLKVKSFKISDDKGINELLTNYRMASGAHILVSEGSLCIPYEDGEKPNKSQLICSLAEQRNNTQTQLDLLIHSQLVLDIQAKGIRKEIERCEAELVTPDSKESYDKGKNLKDEVKRLQNVLSQTENQIVMNQSEVTRLNTNIAVFEESIAKLF